MPNLWGKRSRPPLLKVYGRSIYGALVLMVLGGLLVPAVLGAYLLLGVREEQFAKRELDQSLQRYADIVAVGLRESLWSAHPDAAHALVSAVMRDSAVVAVRVIKRGQAPLVYAKPPEHETGTITRASRDIVVDGIPVGQVELEMDDFDAHRQLRGKQQFYIAVVAVHLSVSLLVILAFLRRRIARPLRALMQFSDRLSAGDFDTALRGSSGDEIGRLGQQLEQMRAAIKQLFDDVKQREARFRKIVTQIPGAVFRFSAHGPVDFFSSRIETISGHAASVFMHGDSETWVGLIRERDRQRQRDAISASLADGKPYHVEYQIIHADGSLRWVAESGQPESDISGAVLWVDGIIVDISERKSHEMRIEALLSEQSAIIDNVMFGVMFVRCGVIVSANRRCETLFAFLPGTMSGQPTSLVFLDIEGAAAAEAQSHFGPDATPALSEYIGQERQYRRHDGSLFWGELNASAINPERPDDGAIWVFADITERRENEEKLRLAARVFDTIADGVFVSDAGGYALMVNPAFTHITGYSETDVIGVRPEVLQAGRENAQEVWRELVETGTWHGETWQRHKNGTAYLEAMTMSAVRDKSGVCTHYVAVLTDVTLLRQAQQKMDHLAHHDPLTGLPNRLLFHDRLSHAITRAGRDNTQLALLFIDLDRFKNVNDTLGHHIGDELLQQVAAKLAEKLRDGDTLARLGGDEFIVLLEGVDGHYGTAIAAEKLMDVFEPSFNVAGHELFVTASIGISLFPSDGVDLNLLIRNADVAMYQSKAHGRNAYRFYTQAMMGEGVSRLHMESQLRRAIERNEIFLHYQPQVDIETGSLLGVEALARWTHPELGSVPPVEFIPIAEETGYINQIGKWVMQEACRQMVRWELAGFVVPKVAVNLSVKQFERGGIVAMVADILAETGLEAGRLQLEVTESVIMNTEDALSFVNDLRAIGVGLAIDDFGTGYSSLAYLKQIPVQTLKIDRSFIQDTTTDASDAALAIAIIELGKRLNMAVIAEGVETAEQAAFLLRNGCLAAQGYLYSRPVSSQDLQDRWRQSSDAAGQ